MCPGKPNTTEAVTSSSGEVKAMIASQSNVITPKSSTEQNTVLRGTMQVRVKGANDQELTVRVVVYSGSDVSYIKRELAGKLNLNPIGRRVFQTEVFGGRLEHSERHEYSVQLKGMKQGIEELRMFSEEHMWSVQSYSIRP